MGLALYPYLIPIADKPYENNTSSWGNISPNITTVVYDIACNLRVRDSLWCTSHSYFVLFISQEDDPDNRGSQTHICLLQLKDQISQRQGKPGWSLIQSL